MIIQAKTQNPASVETDALIVGIDLQKGFDDILSALDKTCDHFFTKQQQAQQFVQKTGDIRIYYQLDNIAAKSVVIIAYDSHQKGLLKTVDTIARYLRSHEIEKAALTLVKQQVATLDEQAIARFTTQQLIDSDYVCDTYKSKPKDHHAITISLLIKKTDRAIKQAITESTAIATGMNTLKNLGNAPGNICTPKYLAQYAKKMAEGFDKLKVTILKEADMKNLGMGSLLSVAKGSVEKPRLIKMHHQGSDDKPIILVGKGVTFDSGGISLKPGAGMDEMKYDMCGAGSVIGVMQAVALMDLPINVMGIIPAVENMPSDRASKPGDIVTSMSGKTIEILNTDAEGRLILCDALTYAQQFKPKALIDIATLTGAVIIALGRNPSALMSNDAALTKALIAAGNDCGDRVWELPLWEEYVEQLQSPFADLQNIGGREAGAITAGCFLGEFTKDTPWAHLDIAGTANTSGKNRGATGRPVPLLVNYLMQQVH